MTVFTAIQSEYALGHRRTLGLLERLTPEQLRWQPAPGTHSIAFEAWHLARWADHLQARLPVMTPGLAARLAPRAEIWAQDDLARAWGFPGTGELGHDQTGMYMADEVAVRLPLPSKSPLVDYTRRSFAAAEAVMAQVPADQLLEPNVADPQETVLAVLLSHLVHDGRHLGMMECLAGIQSGRGTATV